MKRLVIQSIKFLYFFNCFFVVLSMHAHAYIDPSTVTYVIQGVAGVCIAIGATITIFRHKIKAAFCKWYYGSVAKKNKKKAEKAMQEEKNA